MSAQFEPENSPEKAMSNNDLNFYLSNEDFEILKSYKIYSR